MRIIRLLLISAAFLFLAVTAISLLIPSDVRISRALNTEADENAVWRFVDDMRVWPKWNPFFPETMTDSFSYHDASGSRPAGMSIDGTEITWLEKKPGERIAILDKKGFRSIRSGWKCITHTASDSVTIQWYMDFRLRWYPWEKFASLMFEKSYGSRMEQGLAALKKLAEENR